MYYKTLRLIIFGALRIILISLTNLKRDYSGISV